MACVEESLVGASRGTEEYGAETEEMKRWPVRKYECDIAYGGNRTGQREMEPLS